jgi:hypothetical protein
MRRNGQLWIPLDWHQADFVSASKQQKALLEQGFIFSAKGCPPASPESLLGSHGMC